MNIKALTNNQIEAVVEWMNTWEQLKGTAIPLRFKEDFIKPKKLSFKMYNILHRLCVCNKPFFYSNYYDKKGRKNKHQYFLGITKRFQGLGFIISTDNPITINDYFLIEVRFLWVKFWYTYELSNWKSF